MVEELVEPGSKKSTGLVGLVVVVVGGRMLVAGPVVALVGVGNRSVAELVAEPGLVERSSQIAASVAGLVAGPVVVGSKLVAELALVEEPVVVEHNLIAELALAEVLAAVEHKPIAVLVLVEGPAVVEVEHRPTGMHKKAAVLALELVVVDHKPIVIRMKFAAQEL